MGVVAEKSKRLSRNGLPEDAVAASAEDARVDCVVAAGKPTGLCSRSDAVRRWVCYIITRWGARPLFIAANTPLCSVLFQILKSKMQQNASTRLMFHTYFEWSHSSGQ